MMGELRINPSKIERWVGDGEFIVLSSFNYICWLLISVSFIDWYSLTLAHIGRLDSRVVLHSTLNISVLLYGLGREFAPR